MVFNLHDFELFKCSLIHLNVNNDTIIFGIKCLFSDDIIIDHRK